MPGQNSPLPPPTEPAPAPTGVDRNLPRLGQGFVWQDLRVDRKSVV